MTSRYVPGHVDVEDLAKSLLTELYKISEALTLLSEGRFDVLNTAPDKPEDGMLVFADGTNWNPGGGAGAYGRIGGAWVKL